MNSTGPRYAAPLCFLLGSFAAASAVALSACSDDTSGGETASDASTSHPDAIATHAGDSATSPDAPLDGGSDATTLHDAASDSAIPDAGADTSIADSSLPDTSDAALPITCAVRFTVDGASVDAGADAAGGEALYLVGEPPQLGSWNPSSSVPLTALDASTWSGSLVFTEGTHVLFKFIKRAGSSVVWEDWGLYSNRSLIVQCPRDGGAMDAAIDAPMDAPSDADASVDATSDAPDTSSDDASSDAGADAADAGDAADASSGPVVGSEYVGHFNVRPPDAT